MGFLLRNKPNVIVSSGFCGGTSDELKPCDLIIAENFSDKTLTERAREILDEVVTGKIFSADRVIDPAGDRYAIGREHGAIAIDMETATIARLSADFAVPMLALRVISDSPAAPFPAPPSWWWGRKIRGRHPTWPARSTSVSRLPSSSCFRAPCTAPWSRTRTPSSAPSWIFSPGTDPLFRAGAPPARLRGGLAAPARRRSRATRPGPLRR